MEGCDSAAVLNICGNYAGAGVAIKKGAAVIRKMLIVVIVLLFIKVIYDMFFKEKRDVKLTSLFSCKSKS